MKKTIKTILSIFLIFSLVICLFALAREREEKNNIQQQLDIIFAEHFMTLSENLLFSTYPENPQEVDRFMSENLRCSYMVNRLIMSTSYKKNKSLIKICMLMPQICNERLFLECPKDLRVNINKLALYLYDEELSETIYNALQSVNENN